MFFFLNWKNGVSYNLVTQTPQYSIQSLEEPTEHSAQRLSRGCTPEISWRMLPRSKRSKRDGGDYKPLQTFRRVGPISIASVQGRDLGAVGPRGSHAL